MRIPFWDWMLYPQLPDAVTATSLQVTTPDGLQEIPNPLLQYNFPINMVEYGYFPSERNISTLPMTVRHYNNLTGQSEQTAASALLSQQSAQVLSRVYNLFTISPNYTFFASYSVGGIKSVEAMHGNIHDAIGGFGPWAGHMTIIPMSSFDPVFWVHHANLDRLLAMWQAMYPDRYVEPLLNQAGTYYQPANQIDTIDTPLAPFHSDNGSTMWTAATARDTASFGYTYPELLDWKVNGSELSAQTMEIFIELYRPSTTSTSNTAGEN